MSRDVNDWTLEQCRDWLAENDGWTRHERPSVYPDDDALSVWVEELGFSHIVVEGGKITYWTHPKHAAIMGKNPPWHPATLDAAAKALPEGWYQNINHHDIAPTKAGGNFESRVFCIATRKRDLLRVDLTADTELLARFRLACAARRADARNASSQEAS